jgi:hypothetical protein
VLPKSRTGCRFVLALHIERVVAVDLVEEVIDADAGRVERISVGSPRPPAANRNLLELSTIGLATGPATLPIVGRRGPSLRP